VLPDNNNDHDYGSPDYNDDDNSLTAGRMAI